jgi:xanthine dehydrogenase accessory factor
MRELQAVLDAYDAAGRRGCAAALATVVAVSGSSYRRPGARMLVTLDAIEHGTATLAMYDTTGDEDVDFGVGLGCRGVVHVLVEPLPPAGEPCHLNALREMEMCRRPAVLATVWRAEEPAATRLGARLLSDGEGTRWDELGDPALARRIEADAAEVLRTRRSTDRSHALPIGSADVFLEYLPPRVPLVVCGGGRDAVPLVRLASHLGWHVTVVDGRPAFARRERFPGADAVVHCAPAELRDRVELDAGTAAVVMTHNFRGDQGFLQALLPSPVAYLGLLGPRSRAARILREIEESGVSIDPDRLSRLRSPAGLDIGADGPEEIAVSIIAEILAALAGRDAAPLRERSASVHVAGATEVLA